MTFITHTHPMLQYSHERNRVEAKLDAVKGALEVYKGGQLQWSSAGN